MNTFPVSEYPSIVASAMSGVVPVSGLKIRVNMTTYKALLEATHDDGRPVLTPFDSYPGGRRPPGIVTVADASIPDGHFGLGFAS